MKNVKYEFCGEFIGTFILVFFGCGAISVNVLWSVNLDFLQMAVIWGSAVTIAIYASRHLSCAHINPAISLAMAVGKRMPAKKLWVYWPAQFAGAFLAAGALYLIFSDSISLYESHYGIMRGSANSAATAAIFCEYFLKPHGESQPLISTQSAFFIEATGTFLLAYIVFLFTDSCNVGRPSEKMVPVFIGLTVALIVLIIAPLTQAGINPARDLSPRLFAYFAGWNDVAFFMHKKTCLAIYVLGPMTGATAASLFFSKVIRPMMAEKEKLYKLREVAYGKSH